LIEEESREKAKNMRQTRKAPRLSAKGNKMIRQLIIFEIRFREKNREGAGQSMP
jgi:hypothetical protein